MAMANVNNQERARGLIDEAMKRRNKKTSRREKLYIEALDRLIPKPEKTKRTAMNRKRKSKRTSEREAKKKRSERYVADLEKILHEFPDDIEAKAFLVVHLWQADRYGVKLTSRYAVNALLGRNLCRQSDASCTSLPHSFVGFTAAGKCTGIIGKVRSLQPRNCPHVAHAGTHLFQTETIRRRRLATRSIRTRRSRAHDSCSS